MARGLIRLALGLVLAGLSSGCSIPLGPWGGPAYTLELAKVGKGEPAIVPLNDATTWNGEVMDQRTRR